MSATFLHAAAQRAADAEAHEQRRTLRLEAERSAQETLRRQASQKKLAKAEMAKQEQNDALEKPPHPEEAAHNPHAQLALYAPAEHSGDP